jgi:hypothetical protein
MRTITKLMLAAALIAGNGYATFANTNTITVNKPAFATEDRHLSGFHGVGVAGSYDVYITQGSAESVKVEAPDDVIGRIVTEVKDGVLQIYTKKGDNGNWNWGNKKIVIYVTAKDITTIGLAGSGNVFFKNGIKTNALSLKISGSGDILGKVDVQSLESSVAGSGDIKVSGRAQNSTVKVVGSGDFTAGDLVTANTKVNVVGSGDARINVTQKLEASVAGSGDIAYTGGAKQVSKSTAGSGDISSF